MPRFSKQRCVHCPRFSLPGLKKGQGLCAFHWCAAMYGLAYAQKCHADHAEQCAKAAAAQRKAK